MASKKTLRSVSAAASAGADLAEHLAAGRDPSVPLASSRLAADSLRAAVTADPSAPGLLEPLEGMLARLAGLRGLLPPPPLPEPLPAALAGLGRVLRLLSGIAAGSAGPEDARQLEAIASSAARELRLARRAAESDPAGFVENLKFSNIYSGLEDCFFRAEDEAGRLARD